MHGAHNTRARRMWEPQWPCPMLSSAAGTDEARKGQGQNVDAIKLENCKNRLSKRVKQSLHRGRRIIQMKGPSQKRNEQKNTENKRNHPESGRNNKQTEIKRNPRRRHARELLYHRKRTVEEREKRTPVNHFPYEF